MAQSYIDEYEMTRERVKLAMDSGANIAVGASRWIDGETAKMCVTTATLTRPDGRTLTLEGWAQRGDLQAPGADQNEAPFQVMGRAQTRAQRAVANAFLDQVMGEDTDKRPTWQVQLQILMRDVGQLTGSGRDAVRDEICERFGVSSSADLSEQQAREAIGGLRERLRAARGVQ